MPNLNYSRSRSREYHSLKKLELDGFVAFRTAGSHGIADAIGISPNANKCADPNHYEVKLIQVKVSEKFKNYKEELKSIDTPVGFMNVLFCYFPVKSKKYYAKFSKKRYGKLQKGV